MLVDLPSLKESPCKNCSAYLASASSPTFCSSVGLCLDYERWKGAEGVYLQAKEIDIDNWVSVWLMEITTLMQDIPTIIKQVKRYPFSEFLKQRAQ